MRIDTFTSEADMAVMQRIPSVFKETSSPAQWITLPEGIDSLHIYHEALKKNILIAPGCLFSLKPRYNNCLRLNAGHWSDKIRKAIIYIGKLCKEYNPDAHKAIITDECLRAIVE